MSCYRHPSADYAPLPVQVTRESVTPFIISNGTFETVDDAIRCCNLLAQQQNRSPVIRDNGVARNSQVRCSGCKNQLMTFWRRGNEASVRLFDHIQLVEFLEHHPCIIGHPIDAAEIQLWCNESGQRLRIEIEWRRKWRRISNFVQFLHISGFASQQWNRQPNQMEPLMLIDASPPSMAAPVVRRRQGSVLHNRDLCRIISAFIPHQFPY